MRVRIIIPAKVSNKSIKKWVILHSNDRGINKRDIKIPEKAEISKIVIVDLE